MVQANAVVKILNQSFGNSAAAALQQWRFHPAQVNHQAVKCRLQVPVKFNVADDE